MRAGDKLNPVKKANLSIVEEKDKDTNCSWSKDPLIHRDQ